MKIVFTIFEKEENKYVENEVRGVAEFNFYKNVLIVRKINSDVIKFDNVIIINGCKK